MKIEIVETDGGAQKIVDGKLWVYCDCGYMDRCPQKASIGGNRCIIRIDANRLRKKERKRLQESQR